MNGIEYKDRYYFSANYESARSRFREAVCRREGRLFALDLSAKGPAGERLSIDIAWFGSARPRRAFVHSCGLHGVEAFSGSAIQLLWLNSTLPDIPEDGAIILAHVLNPYGMAWLRRGNENNVDLNRNFRDTGETADIPRYWEALNALLNPPTPPKRDWFRQRLSWMVFWRNKRAVRQAIGGGQCLNPKGLFFAGEALEEGPSKFQGFMEERLSAAESIVAIDVHTGLGRSGEDRLLVDVPAEQPHISRAMRDVFGAYLENSDTDGIAYTIRGSQQDMYTRSFPRSRVHFACQEFGTYEPLRVLGALREENRSHFYGNASKNIRDRTKESLLQAFNPVDPEWRHRVLLRGAVVMQQASTLAFAPEGRLLTSPRTQWSN